MIPSGATEYPDSLMALAIIAYQQGRFHDASLVFSKLVAIQPENASHHCNLGECLRECGRFDDAIRQLQLGISIDPNQPDALNSLGLIYHAQHKSEAAESALRQALQLRPEFVMAMINLGMVLQERRRLEEAANYFRQALELEPLHPMGNSNLGQILLEIGRIDDLEEAEQRCLSAVRMTPDRPHPINNLGNVYRAMGRFEDAIECYKKAMAIAPELAMPLNNMAQALHGRGRYEEATEFYLNAIAMDPNAPRFHSNYASLLNYQEKYEDAIKRYEYALRIDPDHAESYSGLGQVYVQLQKTEKAIECFQNAITIDPSLSAPHIGLANLYSEMGEFEKADTEYQKALEIHPKLVEVYYQRATHQKGKVTDHDFNTMIGLTQEKYLNEAARSQLNFALGSVYDKRKEFDTAAQCFKKANEFQRAAKEKKNEIYNPDNFTQWITRFIDAFPTHVFEKFRGIRNQSVRPVFIVGLPRSGTTLTEQILASHSSVHGAGELTIVSKIFEKIPETLGIKEADSFHCISQLDENALLRSAQMLLDELQLKNRHALHVVDKMPDNVNLLGWIRLMFPHAKIIHCRRDLRDIALSCYQTCFGSIRWANDWQHIARRFSDYQRVVKHWESVPEITWLDFSYEQVTQDTETYARKLIEYVGLDWEPDCLNYHETKRQVRTASLSQVRNPIYQTSVAKWRNYEKLMLPFIEEMRRLGTQFSP